MAALVGPLFISQYMTHLLGFNIFCRDPKCPFWFGERTQDGQTGSYSFLGISDESSGIVVVSHTYKENNNNL
jgi:hypothetical protein